jgi:hypothetical protein
MDELQKLYDVLVREGKYTKSFEEFQSKWSQDQAYKDKVYDVVSRDGLYTKDKNSFFQKYSAAGGLIPKPEDQPIAQPVQPITQPEQDIFGFSQPAPKAPSVLTPQAQKEYISEQKVKPAPVVVETPAADNIPKGWETYQAPNKEDEQGLGLNILSSLNKGLFKPFIGEPIKALGTIIERTTALLPRQIRSETGKGVISESLINFGNYFNEAIDEISPQDKEFKDSLTDQFAQAFGQVASTILTYGIGSAASVATKGASMLVKPLGAKAAALAATKEAGKQIVSPAGISSALTMGQSEYERAKEAGATDEQAFEAFYKNAFTGSVLETIPVMQFMKRFNTATNGGVLNYIKTKGVAGLTGGIEELTTEVLQTIYGNKTAQEIYNENQNIFEGIGNAGGIGFGVGFLLNAMGANAKILRKNGKDAEADVLENQIEGIQSRIENGPPPVYKINGLKIESASIVNDMIERMDAPDLFKLNIEIDNDPVLKTKLQDKIVTSSIMEQVREANPELNEPSLKAITELEKQLTLLEGNKTQTGKDKAAAIRTQIKNIQENQLQEEAVAETVVAETPEIAQQRVDRIAEIETIITNDDAKIENPLLEGIRPLLPAERTKLQTELETLKSEQDAIQKQAADESVLRTEQPQMGLQQVGEGNIQPQGITTGTEEVAPTQPQQEVAITTLNPTGTIFTEYTPEDRDRLPLGENITTYDVTAGVNPTEKVTVYRGVPNDVNEIKSGDFVTTNKQLATDYAGTGKVISMEVNANEILDDKTEPLGEEYILRIPQPEVSSQTQAPKFVRDISALITPATVRAFSPLTKRIQKLSLNYDKLVKQYAKKKDPKILAKIKDAEAQILNDAKQEIIDAVAKINGVAVQFKDTKRGLWDGSFEPSFNMILSISPQANTEAVSDLLFDFAEKYSQDAFILESDSELEQDVIDGKRSVPLTEEDSNGLINYPQIIYTFDEPITDEQVADLSVALENNGIDAFNINNNEFQVSIIKTFSKEQEANLNEDEKYEERAKDFGSKTIAAAKATSDVLGSNGNGRRSIRIKKSSYQGATNEGTADQTRQFNKSDVLKAFKESTTKVEKLAVELAGLRQKEIDLQAKGKKLSPKDKTRFDELVKKVQPVVQRTFETNKKLYEDAKTEIEGIAQDAISQVDASISPFPIKKPERASVKTIRWYNAFTEKLGDGARVNIVVDTDTNAEKVFKIIDKKYPGNKEVRRIRETTALGYPKRLIEIVTSNGTIAEIQVITNEAYLAKDGIKGFTGDEKQKSTAKQKLDAVRSRLGWNIPDGLGHYFYEIQRDTNVDDNLRDEAERLSDLYYDAFTNPKSKLSESFMKDVMSFKEQVDAADKSEWDTGNKGIAPQSLVDYNTPEVVVEEEQYVPLTVADVKVDLFKKDNAIDYEEDEKEGDNGRTYTYLSSITVEALNSDGDVIGNVTKVTDEDKAFYFTAQDLDGNEINFDGYETLGEAKKAIVNSYNKIQKKEFDKEAKAKAKEKAKAAAKEAAKKAKAEAKKPVVSETIDDLLDLDVADQDNLDRIFNALDRADKSIGKALGGANEAMLAIPLNVVRIAIKTLKGLVKGGMSLRDAIKKVAADNDISQDTIKDIINIAPIQDSFYALMDKVDALIARQKRYGIEDSKITSNIDTFIRKQDEYLNANDAQKKIIEREARGKMGAASKRAVSIGRVLGALKDITNISRAEKLKVISQIRQLSKDAAKDLAKEIRAMASSGKITAVQAANIISRFGRVNMLNEISVSNFVDYMAKVFANAEYANKIDVAKSKLKNAKQNIATKIGIADGLVGPLQRLFSVNPDIIPAKYLERYLELLNMFSERKAVLTLEEKSKVIKDVESILSEIDIEQSKVDELADRFNNSESKVFNDEGGLDFDASIKEMVKKGEITQEEADVMRKYKSDIMPQVESQKMTDEEVLEKKKEYIAELKDVGINPTGLSSQDERNLAKKLSNLIGSTRVEELMNLSLTDLKNLLKVADNINNNYLPHYAQLIVEKLTAINNAKTLTSAIKKAVIAPFSGLYSRVKSFVLKSKRTAISEMIRRNPLFYVDQLFGDFKTKDIFNSLLSKVSEGESKFKTDLKRVQNILEKAEERVAKSFNLNPDKTLMSKFKMMTYMIQLEYDSNQGSKQVNPAAEYLKATIKHIDEGKSQFGERDANMLQSILKEFAPDGNIDNEKLYKSFNEAEKSAIKDIRGVNESLREKAEYTAAIIRGDRINPLTNYVHLNVLHEHQPNDLTSGVAFVNDYNNAMRPSTKAKSLIERTGKVSPLNFDVFASAQRGAKFVLMDYNLTEPIRTARKTIKQTITNFEKEGRIPKEKRQIINAIDSAFEEATENLLTNTFVSNSFGDDVADYIQKQGYRAVLAGTGRFVSELTSNIGFAVIIDPKAFSTGIDNKGFIMSVDAPLVMENVGSKQTNRVFPTDTLSGKLIDTNILQQASGIRGAKSKNPVANKIQQIWNLSGKKYVNAVELMADTLISTPDKLIMRPMWFGSFANEFKNITGKKVDFDKIAANDESYMGQYKVAIEKAKTTADEKTVMTGATDNAFMGILKGTVKPDQSVTTRAFNNFNNFMTRFLIFEYVTARTGINAAMGNGSLTKKQGVALLGAVTTRMVVYTLLTQMVGTGLMGLFFDDDEEETEKTFMQKLGQSLASAMTSLILGRDFGNATKMIINEGVERANEKYLDFLREGDYDPYKDAIQYSIIPPEKKGRQTDLFDLFLNMGGAFGPALKTLDFIFRKALEPEKKKEEAIERREKEINVRIPLEILGNAGLIPLYKDIRKAVMKDIYKDLEKAQKTLGDKKKIKAEKLQGYETESDMKRYDPDLWDRTFGEDAVDYDEREAEKALKKAKDSLERAMKDEMYNYTPKSKGGFGSAGFGEKSKSKGGFGSAKFGGN